jgi:hypothetical protein
MNEYILSQNIEGICYESFKYNLKNKNKLYKDVNEILCSKLLFNNNVYIFDFIFKRLKHIEMCISYDNMFRKVIVEIFVFISIQNKSCNLLPNQPQIVSKDKFEVELSKQSPNIEIILNHLNSIKKKDNHTYWDRLEYITKNKNVFLFFKKMNSLSNNKLLLFGAYFTICCNSYTNEVTYNNILLQCMLKIDLIAIEKEIIDKSFYDKCLYMNIQPNDIRKNIHEYHSNKKHILF